MLAERLAPEPRLIPDDPGQRALMFGLAHEICGEMGIGWCMRLLMLRAGMDHSDETSIPAEAAVRLAGKYGFNPTDVARAEERVVAVLGLLDAQLGGRDYFIGDGLTALDIYWATMANLMRPLDADRLPMSSYMRGIYATRNQAVLAALTPALRNHQERIYETYLEDIEGEYCLGGELIYHIMDGGKFSEQAGDQIVVQVIGALKYLML